MDAHKYVTAQDKVKSIVMGMLDLSEEGFNNRYRNDPMFHRAFTVFVQLFVDAKFVE